MSGSERGASLLEAMIAVALAAMIAAAAAGIIRFGLTVVERAEAASARGAAALALRRGLADMLTRIDRAAPGAPAFTGDPGAMTWRGPAPGPDGGWRGGVWRIESAGLALSECKAFDGPCAVAAPRAEGVARFDYAGSDGEWRGDWPLGDAPELIRIRLGEAEILIAPRTRGGSQ
ncbi:MAG: hypothetical protein ACK5MQ_17805 [Pikeienuella sp.]